MAKKRSFDGLSPELKRQALDHDRQLFALLCNHELDETDPQLLGIETLFLPQHPLQALPPEIGCLVNLRNLCLDECPLQTLPSQISALTNLQDLHLSGCLIRALPAEISALTNLQDLRLSRCRLQVLPAGISALVHLRILHLDGCPLQALPPEIGGLVKLQDLYLTGCPLQALPSEIGALTNLRKLVIPGCPLEELPPEIGPLMRNGLRIDLFWCQEMRRIPILSPAHYSHVFPHYNIGEQCMSIVKEALLQRLHRDSSSYFSTLPADIVLRYLPMFATELVHITVKQF